MVELLPSMCEALGSIPSNAKIAKQNKITFISLEETGNISLNCF
jgi:hypothetical protein